MQPDTQTMADSLTDYYLIELKKFTKEHFHRYGKLDIWVNYFLGNYDEDDWAIMTDIVPVLKTAKEKEEIFMGDNDMFTEYEKKQQAIMFVKTNMEMAKKQGKDEGLRKVK